MPQCLRPPCGVAALRRRRRHKINTHIALNRNPFREDPRRHSILYARVLSERFGGNAAVDTTRLNPIWRIADLQRLRDRVDEQLETAEAAYDDTVT